MYGAAEGLGLFMTSLDSCQASRDWPEIRNVSTNSHDESGTNNLRGRLRGSGHS